MTQLDDHLARVEQFGFDRGLFPRGAFGHRVDILNNDAHWTEDERIHFHITLYCRDCLAEASISGRFPHSDDEMIRHMAGAKFVVIGKFKDKPCETT